LKTLIAEERYEQFLKKKEQETSTETNINSKSLWTKIAKNEVKVRTSSVRNHRALFFVFIYALVSVWAFVLAPMLFDLFMPQLAEAEMFSGIFVPMVGTIIESMMIMFFLMLLIYPLNIVYRKSEIGFKETLLASPATASDIFIGEFMGKMAFYCVFVLLFAPIIVGLVNPLINLTFGQYFTIYGCVFGLVFLGNLVGSIIASWIERKISQSEKARDLGKALIMLLMILMVVVMYSMMFFLQFLMENPGLRNWLNLYPSLWFSNIIQYMLEPTLIQGYVLNIWTSSILTIGIPILVLYFAYKKAGAFYSLEGGIEKISTGIEGENIFYKFTRKISGPKWGGLITIQFKGFLRKKENIMRLAYALGLMGFIGWFMGNDIDDFMGMVMMSTIIMAVGGALLSIMVGHLIFIDSKDLVWVYKRSPRGLKGLVYSYFYMLLILNILVSIIFTVMFSIIMTFNSVDAIIFFATLTTYTQLSFLQTIGIQCMSPAFEIKGKQMQGNAIISMVIMQIPLFVVIFGMMGLDISGMPQELIRLLLLTILFGLNAGISIPLFIVGMKKLNTLE
jgi:hypothetical protein